MRSIFINGCFIFIMLAGIVGVLGWYQLQLFLDHPLNIQGDGLEYRLNKGGSLSSVAFSLANQGVMETPRWLTVYSRFSGRGESIHAGDYWLTAGLTPRLLLAKLEAGDVRHFQVTLVEGWTVSQVLQHLRKQPRLLHTLNKTSLSSGLIEVEWQGSLEGMFFPDTYRYHSGDSDVSILQQAFLRLQQVLEEEWQAKASGLPYKDSYDALIMASLVEKETGYAPERPQIAGVFVRRLQKRMRLQTDPSIIYGLGEGFDGNLRSHHLKDASNTYNTYRYHGLTPSPIALAGREAIHAALHPSDGVALYFVARGDGSHHFSSTLEEHQRAVRKYQIEQRQKNYSSSPPQGAYVPANFNQKKHSG